MNPSTFPTFRSTCAGVILAAGIWSPTVNADLRPAGPSDMPAAGQAAANTQAAPMPSGPTVSSQAPALQTASPTAPVANMLSEEMIGGIDWRNNVVYAVGDGVPPADAISPAQARVRAKRAAIDEAMARLLETINEVRVDAESTTRNFISENRLVGNRVSGMIRNAEVVEIRQANDGSFQVRMAMPLAGPHGLSAVLLPAQIHKQSVASAPGQGIARVEVGSVTRRPPAGEQAATVDAPAGQPAAVEASPQTEAAPVSEVGAAQADEGAGTVYSALVIDARGLPVVEAMFPRILTRSGEVLYDVTIADPNATVANGLAGYGASLEQLPRAGDNPLVLKAVDVAGGAKADLVIDDADGGRLGRANAAAGFLQQAKVIVLID